MRKKRTVLRLRQLRRAREMSQTALARKVGLKTTMISEIESGRKKPSLENALSLAREFGVSVEEAFSRVEIAS
jgi:putative transcriptional regulator